MAASVKIDDKLKSRIQHLAETRHRSAHWLMLEAIQQYVEREESREKFKQEALSSWQNFQETGLHLTHKEINDWLDTWGAQKEQALPTRHK